MVELCILTEFYDTLPDGKGLGKSARKALSRQVLYVIEEAESLMWLFGRNCPVDDLRLAQIEEAGLMELDKDNPTRDVAAFAQRITLTQSAAKGGEMAHKEPHGYFFQANLPNRDLVLAGLYSEEARPRLTLFRAGLPEAIDAFLKDAALDVSVCDALWRQAVSCRSGVQCD